MLCVLRMREFIKKSNWEIITRKKTVARVNQVREVSVCAGIELFNDFCFFVQITTLVQSSGPVWFIRCPVSYQTT